METIEERAKEYAPGTSKSDDILPTRLITLAALERKAYIAGAKDQQYIDRLLIEYLIDRAWSLAYSMYQVGRDNLTPLTKDEFCKKMEEKL